MLTIKEQLALTDFSATAALAPSPVPAARRRSRRPARLRFANTTPTTGSTAADWFYYPDYCDTNWLIPYAGKLAGVQVWTGDLMYDAFASGDSTVKGVAYPAGQQASQGSELQDQIRFANYFIGCATDQINSAVVNANMQMNVRNEGVKLFPCPSQTFKVGDPLGIYSDGTHTPDSQQLDAALTAAGTIARVAPAPGNPAYYNSAVTLVYAFIQATRGGQNIALSSQIDVYNIGVNANDNITNTSAATAFATTATIPAGTLTVGEVVHVRAAVQINAQNSTNTNTILLKISTAANTFTTVVNAGAANLAANGAVLIDVDLVFSAVGNTGGFTAIGMQGTTAANMAPVFLANTAINTNLAVTVEVTDTQSAASTGNVAQLTLLNVTGQKKAK